MPLNPAVEKLLPELFPLHTFNLEEAREIFGKRVEKYTLANVANIGSIEHIFLKTAKRETPIIIYKPETEGLHPVFVYMHGGGFIFGKAMQSNGFCSKIAKETNCVVVNIDYGLAPEYKFPDPIEECYEVLKWINDNAKELNIDRNRIAVGGDSAGGNISTVLCILARDRREFSILFQALIYPVLDLSLDPFVRNFDGNTSTIRAEVEKWFNDNYLNTPEEGKCYMASPLLTDNLEGVADALIISAECDPLILEETTYAKRLIESGVNVSVQKFQGMIHGFISFSAVLKEALAAQKLVCSRLDEVFNINNPGE
jgi:acetyl esterase